MKNIFRFEYFQKIYCINLKSRHDRKILAIQEFKKLGIEDRVEFFEAFENTKNWHLWCLISHRMIIAEAQKKNLENVLVFEDDFTVIEENLQELALSIKDLKRKKWDIFYLGCAFFFQDIPYLKKNDNLLEVHWWRSTHAIAYNKSFYESFLNETALEKIPILIEKYDAIDVLLSKFLQEKHIAYMPLRTICKQSISFSNTENKIINLDKNILGNFLYLRWRSEIKNKICFLLRKILYFFFKYMKIDFFKMTKMKNYLLLLRKVFIKE